MQRKIGTREIAVIGIFLCLLSLGGWAVFKGVRAKSAQVESAPGGSTSEIAEGEHPEVDGSKSAGYRNHDGILRRNHVDDLWADMQDELDETGSLDGQAKDGRAANEEKALQALLGDDSQQEASAVTPAPPVRKSSGGTGSRTSSSSRPMTQKEKDDKVRHDYELAMEIVQKMYGDQGSGTQDVTAPAEDTPVRRITTGEPRAAASSSMDDWGGTLSSLDDQRDVFSTEENRPFRCMFVREEKIRSGQRVTLRLLEDVVVDGTVIPKNSHLSAVCTIKDRLYVNVSSFEMNGRIKPLDLDGYDTDGAIGIYCPDVNNSAAKTARDDALAIGQAAVRGSVGTIASSVLRTGASIIRSSSSGEQSVTVPSGYTIYLMKNTRR